jgi:hypothetical protein
VGDGSKTVKDLPFVGDDKLDKVYFKISDNLWNTNGITEETIMSDNETLIVNSNGIIGETYNGRFYGGSTRYTVGELLP